MTTSTPRKLKIDSSQDSGLLANGMSHEAAEKYRSLGLWNGDTHWQLFSRAVHSWPDATAAVDNNRTLTWGELDQSVARAAAYLTAQGVCAGDGVIVQLPNSIVFLETIFSIWRLGAVPVFSLPAHGSKEIRHFAAHAPAGFYVSTARPNKHLARVHEHLVEPLEDGSSVRTILIDEKSSAPWGNQDNVTPSESATVQPHELAFLQLSGGTTGVPKQIPRTHDDYLYSVRASIDVCDLKTGDTLLVALPAAHNFTMSSPGILGAIQVGATIIFAPDPMPTTILPLIEQHKVTHLALVPPALISVLNSQDRDNYDLSSVGTVWVGGAKLSEAAARRIQPELGWKLQQVFGMAEGLVNYTPLDADIEEIVTTQGQPMSPYDEIRVVDDEDQELSPGTPGNLLTRGPYTIQQYHRSPKVNKRSFTSDGFYRTGDIVTFIDGKITVVGRAKDQINRGGEKIAPEAVENALLTHPEVHDVSVVGKPDEVLGEKIQAFVICRDDSWTNSPAAVTAPELKRFTREQGLSSFAVPDIIEFVHEFPLTGVGKVSKKHQQQ